jgi:hypothetical protein
VRAGGEEDAGGYVYGSNAWLRTDAQHYRRSRVIERFGHVREYVGHGRHAGIQEMQPHRAASVAESLVTNEWILLCAVAWKEKEKDVTWTPCHAQG